MDKEILDGVAKVTVITEKELKLLGFFPTGVKWFKVLCIFQKKVHLIILCFKC